MAQSKEEFYHEPSRTYTFGIHTNLMFEIFFRHANLRTSAEQANVIKIFSYV